VQLSFSGGDGVKMKLSKLPHFKWIFKPIKASFTLGFGFLCLERISIVS
jgi:hypothetical protein